MPVVLLVEGGCDAATTETDLSKHTNVPPPCLSASGWAFLIFVTQCTTLRTQNEQVQQISLLTCVRYASNLGGRSSGHLKNVFLLIILCQQHLVHNRGLPFGALVGHGSGLVQVVRQGVAGPHGQHVLGVSGADLVNEDLTVLNGLTHRTQAIRVKQLVLS